VAATHPSFDGVHRLNRCGSSSELAPGRSDPLSRSPSTRATRSSVEDQMRSMPGRDHLAMIAPCSARLRSSFEDHCRLLRGTRARAPLSRPARSVAHLPYERSASRLRPRSSHRRSRTPVAAGELSFKARLRSSRSVILLSADEGIQLPHHGSHDPLSKTAAAPSAA